MSDFVGGTPSDSGGLAVGYYCGRSEVESVLSAMGVVANLDDNISGSESIEESGYLPDCLEQGEMRIDQFLMNFYTKADLKASRWIKWCAATLSAYCLVTRRGQSAPDSLQEAFDSYIYSLQQMAVGVQSVPDVARSASVSPGLLMTNYVVDRRSMMAPIRPHPRLSTGPQDSPGQRRLQPYWLPWAYQTEYGSL